MDETQDLLDRLIENHQKSFDIKDPVQHEKKIKQNHPKYVIVADGVFEDEHHGYKNAGLCHTFKTSIYRMHEDSSAVSAPLKHGKLIRKDVIACIPVGRWGASIQSHISESKIIPVISIIRVEYSKGFENTVQKTDFKKCLIMTYDQVDDKILFSFSYDSKTDDFTDYTKDGVKRGHAAYTVEDDDKHKTIKNKFFDKIPIE